MNNRKSFTLAYGFLLILLTILSSAFTLASLPQSCSPQLTGDSDTKVRKVLIYTSGILGTVFDYDTYKMSLKKDVEYVLWAKINAEEGTFIIFVSKGSESHYLTKSWNASSPNRDRVLKITFYADTTDIYDISVGAILASEESKYTLYLNKAGFAGIWWMLLLLLLALLLLLSPLLWLKLRRKKKSRKRRRRKR